MLTKAELIAELVKLAQQAKADDNPREVRVAGAVLYSLLGSHDGSSMELMEHLTPFAERSVRLNQARVTRAKASRN